MGDLTPWWMSGDQDRGPDPPRWHTALGTLVLVGVLGFLVYLLVVI